MDVDDQPAGSDAKHDAWPEELLGRIVSFRGLIGRVQQVWRAEAAHVVILTRDGSVVRVPAAEWDEDRAAGLAAAGGAERLRSVPESRL